MNILLVEDNELMREQLADVIAEHNDMRIIGQAGDGCEGIKQAETLKPDVVIMDLAMPGMNGIEASRAVRALPSPPNILVLSNYTGHNLVKTVLNFGVSGYVCKDYAYEELVPAIRAVAAGRRYLGRGVDG